VLKKTEEKWRLAVKWPMTFYADIMLQRFDAVGWAAGRASSP